MRFHNNTIICLEYEEFVNLFGIEAYKSDKKRNRIVIHSCPEDSRKKLVEYETMPARYKESDVFRKTFGDPRRYITAQPIKALIQKDLKAEQFYSAFVLPTGSKLPDEYVSKYTWAVSYLNTINHLTTDKRALKEQLNVSIAQFWERMIDLLRCENIRLPLSEKRLKEKIKEYKEHGYECLIEAFRFGNSHSKKVNDEVAASLLIEMMSLDHAFDYSRITLAYNAWASETNRPTISERSVVEWAKNNRHLITQNREGNAMNYNKFVKQIRRDRPSAPLLLVNSDDNVLDLYFIDEKVNAKGKVVKSHYYRPVLYVVIDAYNDYILGYAIGDAVTIDLIKEAYRNAANHVKQLLNGYYLPHQIQTDRWGLGKGNELETFYKSMATFTPATVRVAQGKYIERTFGTSWHQTLKQYINYAGQNITAKERLNPDAIEKNKSNFPAKRDAPKQVELFIEAMRDAVNPKTGIPRREEWAAAFMQSEKSKAKEITVEQHLQLFGILNEPKNGRHNTLQPRGLEIKDGRFIYDIPAAYFPQHVGKKVQVYYDPYDMRQVLVTDGRGLRFVAESYINSPSAIADHTTETRQLWNDRMDEKKAIAAVPGIARTKRLEILSREAIDAESMLQGGVLIKQIRHTAEKAVNRAFNSLNDVEEEFDLRKSL